MIRFKSYLIEYLTDEQRRRYKDVRMTDKARSDTDHFFGAGNDIVHGEIKHDDKSEIHKQLETHLDRPLTHDEYSSGVIKDKYGRDAKLGRMIKDENLRNQFDKDPSRKISMQTMKTSTVRGVEVAGQTNSAKTVEHPAGHSWHDISCKNVDNGINNHYLRDEIKHGTVVHRVHDHTGQEIYRATLQPYHHDEHVAYALDAEYGIKHPSFTKSAQDIANKLSGEYRPGDFHKHLSVYNDSGIHRILHPKLSSEHISDMIKRGDTGDLKDVLNSKHPSLTSDHISSILHHHTHPKIRTAAMNNEKLVTPEHITTALNDDDQNVQLSAVSRYNRMLTDEHISRAIHPDRSYIVRRWVVDNPNLKAKHISYILKHESSPNILSSAIEHPNATSKHMSDVLDHKNKYDPAVRASVFMNKSGAVKPEHITAGIDDPNRQVWYHAVNHPKLSVEHVDHILSQGNDDKISSVFSTRSHAIEPQHIRKVVRDPNLSASTKVAAISHPAASSDHLMDAMKIPDLQYDVVDSDHALEKRHIDYAIKHGDHDVLAAVSRRPELRAEHVHAILNHDGLKDNAHRYNIIRRMIQHPKMKLSDLEDIVKTSNDAYIKRGLIAHPDVSQHVLSHVIKHDPDPIIRRDAINHSKTHIDDLAYAATHDPDPATVSVALRHPKTPLSAIQHVVKTHSDPSIRARASQILNQRKFEAQL